MKGKLRPSLHYRLVLLSRGPRFYAAGYKDILRLEKLGLTFQTGVTSADGAQEWVITEAGRLALQAHVKGGAP